ncbi:MAG: GNAT family N-acetyltransferase [Saprospiraceae bacterium]
MGLVIKEGDVDTAMRLSRLVPEFIGPPEKKEYKRRLSGKTHLILIAWLDDKPVGFKVGYQEKDYFYSWMGGVLPSYRRRNVARKLAEAQEAWARRQGIRSIVFKTRNQHKNMLLFAISRGFQIVGFKEKNR